MMLQMIPFPLWRLPRLTLAPLLLLLAACATSPFVGNLSLQTLQTSRQFVVQRLDQTWAAPPGALVMIERSLGTEGEQIVGLSNDTTLDGDNFLWLRARVPDGRSPGQFDLKSFLARTEGVPSPFTEVSDQNLRQARDALGTYFYLEWRSGGSTNCVLAFRRIDGAIRQLPRGTNVLEVMLRNCVQGSITQALAPIQDRQIAGARVAGSASSGTGNRMLSPLAGPPIE